VAFLAIRVALLCTWLACCTWSIVSWVQDYSFKYWLTKLTHWGAIVELLYLSFAVATTSLAIFSSIPDGKGEATPWFVKVTWVLSSMLMVAVTLVFVMYWLLVYTPGPGKPAAISVVMHGGNFAIALVDLLLTRQPFYFEHIYIPFVFALVYVFFTALYYLAGGTFEDGKSRYIYSSIDWNDAGGTGSLLGVIVIVAVPLIYTVFFFVVAGRVCCRKLVQAEPVVIA